MFSSLPTTPVRLRSSWALRKLWLLRFVVPSIAVAYFMSWKNTPTKTQRKTCAMWVYLRKHASLLALKLARGNVEGRASLGVAANNAGALPAVNIRFCFPFIFFVAFGKTRVRSFVR